MNEFARLVGSKADCGRVGRLLREVKLVVEANGVPKIDSDD